MLLLNVTELILWCIFPLTATTIFIMGVTWQFENKEDYRSGLNDVFCKLATIATVVSGLISLLQSSSFTIIYLVKNLLFFDLYHQQVNSMSFLFQFHVICFCLTLIILPFTKYIKLFNLLSIQKLTIQLFNYLKKHSYN